MRTREGGAEPWATRGRDVRFPGARPHAHPTPTCIVRACHPAAGMFDYVPPAGFVGTGRFRDSASDGTLSDSAKAALQACNDHPVLYDALAAVFESTPLGTLLGDLRGYEPDSDDVRSCLFGDGPIALDRTTGAVTLVRPVRYAVRQGYVMTAQAVDDADANNVGVATIRILVADPDAGGGGGGGGSYGDLGLVPFGGSGDGSGGGDPPPANRPPEAKDAAFTVPEMTAGEDSPQPGDEVGRIEASDPDGDGLTFALVDQAVLDADGDPERPWIGPPPFAVDATGTVRFSSDALAFRPDYETGDTYELTVEVRDGRGGVKTVIVAVTLEDRDDPPVASGGPYAVSEYAIVGTVIGKATATDEDKTEEWGIDSLTWEITNGPSFIDVDPDSGEVLVAGPLRVGTHQATLKVTSGGGASDEIEIEILVSSPPLELVGPSEVDANTPEALVVFGVDAPLAQVGAADGLAVTFELRRLNADGTQTVAETKSGVVEDGLADVLFTGFDATAGAKYDVEAAFGGRTVVLPAFVVVAGAARTLTFEAKETLTGDGVSAIDVTVVARDGAGNLVADGTPVDWEDFGTDALDILDAQTADGRARARITSSGLPAVYQVKATIDGVEAVHAVNGLPILVSVARSSPTLDISVGQSVTIQAIVTDVNGVRVDGAEVRWFSQKGTLIGAAQTVDGVAIATLYPTLDQADQLGVSHIFASVASVTATTEVEFVLPGGTARLDVEDTVLAGDATSDGVESVQQPDGTIAEVPYKAVTAVRMSNLRPFALVKVSLAGDVETADGSGGYASFLGGGGVTVVSDEEVVVVADANGVATVVLGSNGRLDPDETLTLEVNADYLDANGNPEQTPETRFLRR